MMSVVPGVQDLVHSPGALKMHMMIAWRGWDRTGRVGEATLPSLPSPAWVRELQERVGMEHLDGRSPNCFLIGRLS